jgi:hypothetical protein
LGSYFGGTFDALVQRVMEGIMAFPSLVLAMALVALAGPSVIILWCAIAFSSLPRYARLVRSGVLTQKEREYVDAGSGHGTESHAYPWLRQICRTSWHRSRCNLLSTWRAPSVSKRRSATCGLGLSVPYISWGTMIRDAQDFLEVAPWLAIFPGLALAGFILAFTLVGDALRDRMDPRMRRSLSRPDGFKRNGVTGSNAQSAIILYQEGTMAIAAIDHWVLVVKDLEETFAFYRKLGLEAGWQERPGGRGKRPIHPHQRDAEAQSLCHRSL